MAVINSPIDMNAMAASVYNTVMQLQQSATQMVGLDVLWCRALPYENSEDVIVQEYTLSNVDCPKPLKVICDKTDYQAGTFTFGALGIDFDSDLSISINLPDWEAVYGKDTMPQKGDILIIKLINRAYEVSSSQVVYTLTSMPTSYKCVLRKYQRQASRRESEDFRISIDELTTSQDVLFGDEISKEVADAAVEVETAYNNSTYVDPLKDYDIDSIVMEHIEGPKNTLITDAYYDFSKAKQNIKYHVDAVYDKNNLEANHWIFTTWFRILGTNDMEEGIIKFPEIYTKEKSFWYFEITQSAVTLHPGDEIILSRGNMISVKATVEPRECDFGYVLRIALSEVLKINKKLTNWWSTGIWKAQKFSSFDLFSGYSQGDNIYNINVSKSEISLRFGNVLKTYTFDKAPDFNHWHYLAVDLSSNELHAIVIEENLNEKTGKIKQIKNIDKEDTIKAESFDIEYFSIDNMNKDVHMCNIRLYENKYSIGDTYKVDMYSQITRNASKLILVDTPNTANKMRFISPIK